DDFLFAERLDVELEQFAQPFVTLEPDEADHILAQRRRENADAVVLREDASAVVLRKVGHFSDLPPGEHHPLPTGPSHRPLRRKAVAGGRVTPQWPGRRRRFIWARRRSQWAG